MERARRARVTPGAFASVSETCDDEVLPDAPSFEETPKLQPSSDTAPSFFSVEPVPLTRYCPHVTKEACKEARGTQACCEDVHFRRIRHSQTSREPNADCHFLQLCRFATTTCRFQHWEIDDDLAASGRRPTAPPLQHCAAAAARVPERLRAIPEPQWICADLGPSGLDLATLGEFGVVVVDPPWVRPRERARSFPSACAAGNAKSHAGAPRAAQPSHRPTTLLFPRRPSASTSRTTHSPTHSSAS